MTSTLGFSLAKNSFDGGRTPAKLLAQSLRGGFVGPQGVTLYPSASAHSSSINATLLKFKATLSGDSGSLTTAGERASVFTAIHEKTSNGNTARSRNDGFSFTSRQPNAMPLSETVSISSDVDSSSIHVCCIARVRGQFQEFSVAAEWLGYARHIMMICQLF